MAASSEVLDMETENVISNNEEMIPGYPDVASYSKSLLSSMLKATRASNKIPSPGEKYDFYNNFSGFRQLMRAEGKTILDLMTRILQHQGCKGTFQDADLEDRFDLLVDANDSIMERAGLALDEASGRKKKDDVVVSTIKYTKPIKTSWNKKESPSLDSFALLAAKNVARPQMKFKRKVDNSNTPFLPFINDKPNSIKPLSILPEVDENGQEVFSHPYEIEIEKFQPKDQNLEKVTPQIPKKIEETELVFVNTVSDLKNLCSDLSQVSEFAVDLENHSYRSLQGITCLMQISTRTCDYIVDTLELREELQQLNEIFTNPKVVKVLHGADMDVQWLQRDFSLYLVNLFDTGQASRILNYSHFSLAFLLKHFCNVDPDKSFQLADWRIRPLTEKMVLYAREDTHYLLYIYDCMRNELLDKGNLQKNLLLSVYQRSKVICQKRYQKLIYKDDSYLALYQKSKKRFNTRQLYALKELYAWRDKLSRQEDESYGYVLPNHMMLQMAEMLPREQQGIFAFCNPIPPLVKQQLNELHLIILKAREWNEEKLSVPASHLKMTETQLPSHVKIETSLSCPHDLPNQEDTCLQSLLTDNGLTISVSPPSSVLTKAIPALSAFDNPQNIEKKPSVNLNTRTRTKIVHHFLEQMISPFQRFKLAERSSTLESVTETQEIQSPEQSGANQHVERVLGHLKNLVTMSGEVGNPSSEPNGQDSETQKSSHPNSNEVDGSSPIVNQLQRKRKRKNKRPIPSVSLSTVHPQLEAQNHPQQKNEFHPFDFEKARETLFKERNNASTSNVGRKRSFDPNDNYFKNKRGKFTHKNRGARSMTYGPSSQNFNKKQWPKR